MRDSNSKQEIKKKKKLYFLYLFPHSSANKIRYSQKKTRNKKPSFSLRLLHSLRNETRRIIFKQNL